jgi:hypothetical protein
MDNYLPFRGHGRSYARNPYVVVLLHFNGPDESNTFEDETGKIWTPTGLAQMSTIQSKFGLASGHFRGGGGWSNYDMISTPACADLDMGTGDWTLDFWTYPETQVSPYPYVFANIFEGWVPGGINLFYNYDTLNRFQFYYYGSSVLSCKTSTDSPPNTAWVHIAIVRKGTSVKIYLNGISGTGGSMTVETTDSFNFVYPTEGGNYFRLGWSHTNGGQGYAGYIDEFRILKGKAQWTGNFVPPMFEYKNIYYSNRRDRFNILPVSGQNW